MKTRHSEKTNRRDQLSRVDYSVLVVIGAILSMALLSGCASVSMGGGGDPDAYNPVTGYPAVGSAAM